MATAALGNAGKPIEVKDDDSIDDDQLEEYREEVEDLGSFPVSLCSRPIAFVVAECHCPSNIPFV